MHLTAAENTKHYREKHREKVRERDHICKKNRERKKSGKD